jgi:hypothetical protein
MMLDQRTLDKRKINVGKTRRRPRSGHRSAVAGFQRPPNRPQPLQPLNKLRPPKRSLKPPPAIQNPTRPRMKPGGSGGVQTSPKPGYPRPNVATPAPITKPKTP